MGVWVFFGCPIIKNLTRVEIKNINYGNKHNCWTYFNQVWIVSELKLTSHGILRKTQQNQSNMSWLMIMVRIHFDQISFFFLKGFWLVISCKQECIPVGCIPRTVCPGGAQGGVCPGRCTPPPPPVDRHLWKHNFSATTFVDGNNDRNDLISI